MAPHSDPEVSPADWWVTRDEPWHVLCTVGPSGFPAYAQVSMPLDDSDERLPLLPDVGVNWDDQVCAAVREVLTGFTSTPEDAFWCVWTGADHEPGPVIRIPHREYVLHRGSISEASGSPAALWPADRAWFLAFDVDPDWAAVGASAAAVEVLAVDPRIGARPLAWDRFALEAR